MSHTTPISRRSLLAAAGFGALSLTALAGCGNAGAGAGSVSATTLTVAASPAPHAEILTGFAAPKLKERGIELMVKEYTDYIQPNRDTESGAVDANYFQHVNYLDNYNAKNGTDLVNAGKVHYEPMGVFAGRASTLEGLAEGATFAIPNDPTNEGRALLLLQDLGLIALAEDAGLEATPNDIVENPQGLQFQELESAALPRALDSVDFAVINGNYAIEAGLHVADAVAREESDSTAIAQYANVVCASRETAGSKAVAALVEVLQSEEFHAYLEENYGEDVLPA